MACRKPSMRRLTLPAPFVTASPAHALALALVLTACAATPPEGPPRKETVMAVTSDNQLIRFNAGRPGRLLSRVALKGLQPGESVLGIDYRVAKGELYAVSSSNRLFRINPTTGVMDRVGQPFAVPLTGTHFGVDFNPTVDRLRIVSDSGQNLRVHPDTGAVVDGNPDMAGVQPDGPLAYVSTDGSDAQRPAVVAVAYTYHKTDDKLTTNFALDAATGTLAVQGSREGVAPVVSPNTGRLTRVGALEAGPFDRAAFDIADVSGAAFASLGTGDGTGSRWVEIDLATGRARVIGTVAGGAVVTGIAIEP